MHLLIELLKLLEQGEKMVLYHAISSYQLLEVMLHRYIYHKKEKAVLILPDFITEKYPQYHNLVKKKFFEEVYLFPYTKIPHTNEKEIFLLADAAYRELVPWDLKQFQKIYVAGAHFYFSLLLIYKKISFEFFEDAAGILSCPEILLEIINKKYPIQGAIAQKYGLITGDHPCICSVIYKKTAQKRKILQKVLLDFSVEDELENIPHLQRRRFRHFFIKKRFWTSANLIFLTQHFSNMGIMEEEEQKELYKYLYETHLKKFRLIIKKHPDDKTDYSKIFPKAQIIQEVFPSEFLPYVFWRKPKMVCSLSSTSMENLRRHFSFYVINI